MSTETHHIFERSARLWMGFRLGIALASIAVVFVAFSIAASGVDLIGWQ
jgi:hypothetical protein